MAPVFDTPALHEWADTPWPDDRREQIRLFNQLRTDCAAAALFIDELVALEESRAELRETYDPEGSTT